MGTFFSYFTPLCRKAGFVPRIVQEAFNSAGILGLVASGMGLTVLTESAQGFSRDGLVSIPLKNISERLPTVAIWGDESLNSTVKLFGEFIEKFDSSAGNTRVRNIP